MAMGGKNSEVQHLNLGYSFPHPFDLSLPHLPQPSIHLTLYLPMSKVLNSSSNKCFLHPLGLFMNYSAKLVFLLWRIHFCFKTVFSCHCSYSRLYSSLHGGVPPFSESLLMTSSDQVLSSTDHDIMPLAPK